LRTLGRLRDTAAAASRLLSVSADDVPVTIERLQTESKRLARAVREFQEEVATDRAARWRAEAPTIGGLRVVVREERGWQAAGLKMLAAALVTAPSVIAVLVGDGQPAPVVVARSADVTLDAGAWITRAVAELGGRGGGRPELAQAGLTAPAEQILAWARHTLG
jgi:alanyl-tRNA synthetase